VSSVVRPTLGARHDALDLLGGPIPDEPLPDGDLFCKHTDDLDEEQVQNDA
jgi:hypothetical protein